MQQFRDAVTQEVARRRAFPTDGRFTDAELLRVAADAIVASRRRQTALTPIACLPLLFFLPSAAVYPPLAIGSMALSIVLYIGFAGPTRLCTAAQRWLRDGVLERVTPETLPDLLRILTTVGKSEEPLLDAVGEAILRVVPGVFGATLDTDSRERLGQIALRYHERRPMLTVAALMLLTDASDPRLALTADWWAREPGDTRLRAAAADYLRVLRETP